MQRTTKVSISEINEHGFGFEAEISVDPSLPQYVSFDIAWGQLDDDGNFEAVDPVGVIMSAEGANALADRLRECAYRVEDNLKNKKDDATNG